MRKLTNKRLAPYFLSINFSRLLMKGSCAIMYTCVHKIGAGVMNLDLFKIGVREFRAHVMRYLKSPSPIAITCHGKTLGYYIPTHQPSETDVEELKRAALQLDKLLISNGLTEEELLADFRALRQGTKKHKEQQ